MRNIGHGAQRFVNYSKNGVVMKKKLFFSIVTSTLLLGAMANVQAARRFINHNPNPTTNVLVNTTLCKYNNVRCKEIFMNALVNLAKNNNKAELTSLLKAIQQANRYMLNDILTAFHKIHTPKRNDFLHLNFAREITNRVLDASRNLDNNFNPKNQKRF